LKEILGNLLIMKKITPADPMQGAEPSWTKQDSENQKLDLMASFNWYNYNCSRKDAKEFVIDYLKKLGRNKEEIGRVKSLSESVFPLQFGWLSRMMSLGFVPSEKTKSYFTTTYRSILSETEKVKVVVEEDAPAYTVSIQQRISEKAHSEAGEIEGLIDDFIASKCKKEIDMEVYLKSRNLSSVVLKKVCDLFVNRNKEINEALTTKDAQLIEGYKNFTKPELRRLKDFIDSIVSAANKGSVDNKPVRKKRKTKEKPAALLVTKVNYLPEFAELSLKSVLPERIVGANQVWTYNTKTKLLGVYNASNGKGLTIKGTTIQNFEETTSIGKRLRKPEQPIKDVLDGGKIKLRKIFSDLKTKESLLTGRLNSDTIILRVI
jgi:hypothetical protein